MLGIPFETTDWAQVEETLHPGEEGTARWRTRYFGGIRVRRVVYSAGYLADHWCRKGHILFVLEGQLNTELDDGRTFALSAGMSYQVADGAEGRTARPPRPGPPCGSWTEAGRRVSSDGRSARAASPAAAPAPPPAARR